MGDNWCWYFTIIFTLIFIGLGVAGTYFGRRGKYSTKKVWIAVGSFYCMVLLQMYLIYAYPPPGKSPSMPRWLLILIN